VQVQSRRVRKTEQTRARLLEGARSAIVEHGPDVVTVAHITEAADVGTGTFYNYFTTRDDIVSGVLYDTVESLGRRLDAMTRNMPDPAEVFASSLRHLMEMAITDPLWRWYVVRIDVSHAALIERLGPRAARDIQRGVDEGRFQVASVPMVADIVFGSLLAAIHAFLGSDGRGGQPAAYAELNLRMVGLSLEDAAEVVQRPLPILPPLPAQEN